MTKFCFGFFIVNWINPQIFTQIFFCETSPCKSVFGIHDILVRILMRIRESCSFLQWLSRRQQKLIFFSLQFLCLFLLDGTFTLFFKDKSHNEFTKQYGTVETKFFLHCLLTEESRLRARSGSVQINYGSGFGSRRPKNIRIRILNPALNVSLSVVQDALPLGTFTKYTWSLTNILQVKQIFDTPLGMDILNHNRYFCFTFGLEIY